MASTSAPDATPALGDTDWEFPEGSAAQNPDPLQSFVASPQAVMTLSLRTWSPCRRRARAVLLSEPSTSDKLLISSAEKTRASSVLNLNQERALHNRIRIHEAKGAQLTGTSYDLSTRPITHTGCSEFMKPARRAATGGETTPRGARSTRRAAAPAHSYNPHTRSDTASHYASRLPPASLAPRTAALLSLQAQTRRLTEPDASAAAERRSPLQTRPRPHHSRDRRQTRLTGRPPPGTTTENCDKFAAVLGPGINGGGSVGTHKGAADAAGLAESQMGPRSGLPLCVPLAQ
ncbi:hypothetical protein WOLCODRAFT_152400 [Wolfiporia cocos MD-104 SS10]|uniref:Uncharacterized protein n=1 Tax=Wolfiporia cocos (strain MD-104) TaxID=742152 RepID=A0A2H3K041_WOLCO|nr:hypothetical protein WOLCODRAFT_152400 [Wolfiporia cocos MD-104 SS10]